MSQHSSLKQHPRRHEPRRPRSPKLTTADLRNDAKVLEWYSRTQTTPVSIYDGRLYNVFAAAERALEHGDDPPALFVHIVGGKQWHLITCEQEDRARQRLLRLRNPERAAQLRRRRDDDDDHDDPEWQPVVNDPDVPEAFHELARFRHAAVKEPCSVGEMLKSFLAELMP